MQPIRSFLNSIKDANESCFVPILRRYFSCSSVSQSHLFQRTMSGSRDVVIEAKDGKHSATVSYLPCLFFHLTLCLSESHYSFCSPDHFYAWAW